MKTKRGAVHAMMIGFVASIVMRIFSGIVTADHASRDGIVMTV